MNVAKRIRGKLEGWRSSTQLKGEGRATWPRYLLLIAVAAMAPLMMLGAHRYISATEQRSVERDAIKIAEVVAQQALVARAAYEAAIQFEAVSESGMALPSPDEFINRVGEMSEAPASEPYAFRWLPSRADNPPLDSFHRWAWKELEAQSARHDGGAIVWEPVWRLGTFDGRRLLRYVRPVPAAGECAGCPDLPRLRGALEVLVPIQRVEAIAALQTRGAQNIVISVGVLGFTLVTFLAMRSARQHRGLARRFEQLAKVDTLTGLANRLEIEQRMHERLLSAARAKQGMGVMFIDVDDFKNINDSLGHSAGDQVLQVIAERMTAALRDSDLIARYSGDEFVILVSNVSDAGKLANIATKLLEAVSPVVRVLENDIFVTLSIGIAYYPTDGMDASTLLKSADTAMYRAKEKGRNGFQFFAAEMNAAAMEKLQMSSSLWRAVKKSEFLVYYQPKEDARTGHIRGFEALVRWNHPEQGILSPDRFIPHAEYSGAIEPLGEWVLGKALAQMREWQDVFDGTIAVNLSMRQLYNPELPTVVRRELARHGIAPERLELEVTESMVSMNPEVAARTLGDLSRLGVSIALDDFGTGQSSLAYLLRFPIRTLKVDRSFTVDVPACQDACSIVRAIVALARSLRLRVVAEGVENEAQKKFFLHQGVDEIQGYLIGMPLPVKEATMLLEDIRMACLGPEPHALRESQPVEHPYRHLEPMLPIVDLKYKDS